MKSLPRHITILTLCLLLIGGSVSFAAPKKKQKSKQPQPTESKAAIEKKQSEAQKDIEKTKQDIAVNEQAVKDGLFKLGQLDTDIASTQSKIASTAQQIKDTEARIAKIEGDIRANEAQLEKLRKEYMDAVKKMRKQQHRTSAMAFVFASKSFRQAERRVRYLKRFADWRKRQTREIESKINTLNHQKKLLAQTKADKDRLLASQQNSQRTLEKQKGEQTVLVADLKKNGEALRAHLKKRQGEVNRMSAQISELIAQDEQRKEAARQQAAREQAAKDKAAREQAAREQAAKEQAAKEQAAREQAAKEQAAKEKPKKEQPKKEQPKKESPKKEQPKKETAKKEQPKKEQPKKEQPKKEQPKKEQPKKETAKKEQPKKEQSKPGKGSYAEARNRKPRSEQHVETTTVEHASVSKGGSTAPSHSNAGSFEACKGQLPTPVNGSFKVVRHFGSHAIPSLPDVVYDNPGVDAEVPAGATARAIYGGKVTGVYRLDGFSTVVIVNHGDYYTVYGNLSSTSVKTGDNVNQGQTLGTIGADSDSPGKYSIHFEVRKGRTKLNPMEWIR